MAQGFPQKLSGYVESYELIKAKLDLAKQRDAHLAAYLAAPSSWPGPRRLDIDSYLHRPVNIITRLVLLGKALSKETDDKAERDLLNQAVDRANSFVLWQQDHIVAPAEARARAYVWSRKLVWPPEPSIGENNLRATLGLEPADRGVLYECAIYRKTDSPLGNKVEALKLLLTDQCFIILRRKLYAFAPDPENPPGDDSCDGWETEERPIPLELLVLHTFSDAPIKASIASAAGAAAKFFPLAYRHMGTTRSSILFVASEEERSRLQPVIEGAIEQRHREVDSWAPLRVDGPLAQKSFAMISSATQAARIGKYHSGGMASHRLPRGAQPKITGSILSCVTFTTRDARERIAVVTEGPPAALWIGWRSEPSLMWKKVKTIDGLKSIGVLTCATSSKEGGILLLLVDRQLCLYPLDAVAPPNRAVDTVPSSPMRMVQNVAFFTLVSGDEPRVLCAVDAPAGREVQQWEIRWDPVGQFWKGPASRRPSTPAQPIDGPGCIFHPLPPVGSGDIFRVLWSEGQLVLVRTLEADIIPLKTSERRLSLPTTHMRPVMATAAPHRRSTGGAVSSIIRGLTMSSRPSSMTTHSPASSRSGTPSHSRTSSHSSQYDSASSAAGREPSGRTLRLELEGARVVAAFPVGVEEWLLCYRKVGLYMNASGWTRLGAAFAWECEPRRVVHLGPSQTVRSHVVVGISPSMLEVRDARSGRLVQAVRGEHWTHIAGPGSSAPLLIQRRPTGWPGTEDQRIHTLALRAGGDATHAEAGAGVEAEVGAGAGAAAGAAPSSSTQHMTTPSSSSNPSLDTVPNMGAPAAAGAFEPLELRTRCVIPSGPD